jgi:hypothetical protein
MEFEYLSDSDGNLLPISHFNNCIFILYFTKYKCKPCLKIAHILERINFYVFSNVVPVVVSMDNTLADWDKCFKMKGWLYIPFYPIDERKKLFRKYKVNCTPFMTVCDSNTDLSIPRHILNSGKENLENYIEYCINCFDLDDFILL